MNTTTQGLGEFNVVSGKLVISDPCYRRGTWCMGELQNVKNGKWAARVELTDDEGRVAELVAYHSEDGSLGYLSSLEPADFSVGVDSGQAGIFDGNHFRNDNDTVGYKLINPDQQICEEDPWYSMCCDMTLHSECRAGTIPFGVVSSSGYGDGGYECKFGRDAAGQINYISIVFIEEEEEEDDDVDYWFDDDEE